MSQSLSNIIIHMIFSTKERKPSFVDKPTREQLFQYARGIMANQGCPSIIVGGVEDHMHLLLRFSRTETISNLVKQIKRGTSNWLKLNGYRGFAWQSG